MEDANVGGNNGDFDLAARHDSRMVVSAASLTQLPALLLDPAHLSAVPRNGCRF
jgi:hypothetical protein